MKFCLPRSATLAVICALLTAPLLTVTQPAHAAVGSGAGPAGRQAAAGKSSSPHHAKSRAPGKAEKKRTGARRAHPTRKRASVPARFSGPGRRAVWRIRWAPRGTTFTVLPARGAGDSDLAVVTRNRRGATVTASTGHRYRIANFRHTRAVNRVIRGVPALNRRNRVVTTTDAATLEHLRTAPPSSLEAAAKLLESALPNRRRVRVKAAGNARGAAFWLRRTGRSVQIVSGGVTVGTVRDIHKAQDWRKAIARSVARSAISRVRNPYLTSLGDKLSPREKNDLQWSILLGTNLDRNIARIAIPLATVITRGRVTS